MARVKVLYEADVWKMISGVGEIRWYRGRFRPYCESSKGIFFTADHAAGQKAADEKKYLQKEKREDGNL